MFDDTKELLKFVSIPANPQIAAFAYESRRIPPGTPNTIISGDQDPYNGQFAYNSRLPAVCPTLISKIVSARPMVMTYIVYKSRLVFVVALFSFFILDANTHLYKRMCPSVKLPCQSIYRKRVFTKLPKESNC